METLNVIGSFASILSLVLSVFIASKVYKINVQINSTTVEGQNDSKQSVKGVGNKQAGRDING